MSDCVGYKEKLSFFLSFLFPMKNTFEILIPKEPIRAIVEGSKTKSPKTPFPSGSNTLAVIIPIEIRVIMEIDRARKTKKEF